MNQRIGRNSNDKNKTNFVSFATGGHVTRNTPNEQPSVQVPPYKATGDIKPEPKKGTAKASPKFKEIEPPVKPLTTEDEKKAIAANAEIIKENDTNKQ